MSYTDFLEKTRREHFKLGMYGLGIRVFTFLRDLHERIPEIEPPYITVISNGVELLWDTGVGCGYITIYNDRNFRYDWFFGFHPDNASTHVSMSDRSMGSMPPWNERVRWFKAIMRGPK